jgi:uncharacterized protein YcsI (UPF0317 family)
MQFGQATASDRAGKMPGHAHGAQTGVALRQHVRSGLFTGQTAGAAPGHVQGNLVVLPEALAGDFLRYCQLNPKPCPIIGMSEPGSPFIPALGADLDIRTDLPLYRVWRNGVMTDQPREISDVWRSDLVAFVLGCSFSFEEALIQSGIALRHVVQGLNVAMYRTTVTTVKAGPFEGPLVVSMRPLKAADAIRAIQITSRFPSVHGAPVHIGRPDLIGIHDLSKPDYGDAVDVTDDEIPVFWACGVTPQAAIAAMKPDFAITHAPGCMLVTDVMNSSLAVF